MKIQCYMLIWSKRIVCLKVKHLCSIDSCAIKCQIGKRIAKYICILQIKRLTGTYVQLNAKFSCMTISKIELFIKS